MAPREQNQIHIASLADLLTLFARLFHGLIAYSLFLTVGTSSAWGISGPNGAVAAEHDLGSRAGIEMLQKGGNAVDAAVAAAFAVCVVNPSSCGIGGGGFMLIYLASERRALSLDFRETAPNGATRDMFLRNGKFDASLSRRGGLAVGVPGEVAGLLAALDRFGKLPRETVMEPAIRYARDGFWVAGHLTSGIRKLEDKIFSRPALRRILLRPDGSLPQIGETIKFPELAVTLQEIADRGAKAFYRGVIAERIVNSVVAQGGVLTLDDLANFRPKWREPLSTQYREHQVYTMPPPSSGGIMLQILEILEHDWLAMLGPKSPAFRHLLTEAMKHGFADRARSYGDSDFVSVPLEEMLSQGNTARLRKRIRTTSIGKPDHYGTSPGSLAAGTDDRGTSHLSVMDKDGNAVACTTTINTSFGSMVVAEGTGIILNNEMDDFSAQPGVPNVYGLIGAEANSIAPGKRPLSSMSPTIVVKDGKPTLAVGGSGGPMILSATLQTVLNVVDFAMDVEGAVAAPRSHHQWMPPVLIVEPEVSLSVREELTSYGHHLRVWNDIAAVQAVGRRDDLFQGASDPRKGGQARAW